MRFKQSVSILLVSTFVCSVVFAQEDVSRDILAAAEYSYPESQAPTLFGPGSESLAFAGEAEDPAWSADMESRILGELEKEREQGLILRRVEVECRSSMCALLLVHAASNRSEGSVGDLAKSMRETLGFVRVNMTEKTVMVPDPGNASSTGNSVKLISVSAYVELVLQRGTDAGI